MNLKHIYNEPYVILSKLKGMLGYKDMRSVIEWCEKNGVYVMQQGNQKLVNSTEFLLSFYKPFIQHLKSKHKDWKERFIDYLEGNVKNLLTEQEFITISIQSKTIKEKRVESSFLQKLKNL